MLQEKFDALKYVSTIESFLEKNAIDPNYVSEIQNSTSKNVDKLNSLTPSLMRSDSTGENFKKHFKPIIYVSMGTVFNNENSYLFEILVEACKYYSDSYSIIVSTGDEKAYQKYANSSLNSDKILFVPHTPQVEILKRAHLFITHAGMNSVSEALQYGVPIICLPLSGDQPFVAWRVADELGIGIRLQPDNSLTVEKVRNAISKILFDPIYHKRANDIANISKRYCGHKTAADDLINFIQENDPNFKYLSNPSNFSNVYSSFI